MIAHRPELGSVAYDVNDDECFIAEQPRDLV